MIYRDYAVSLSQAPSWKLLRTIPILRMVQLRGWVADWIPLPESFTALLYYRSGFPGAIVKLLPSFSVAEGEKVQVPSLAAGPPELGFSLFLLSSQHSCQPGTQPFPRKPRREANC